MEAVDLQRVLRLLPVFVTVAETEQVTVAASILRMPQPTVSRALSTLAELIGTPLVERQGRGIVLTAAGRELLPYARAGLDTVAAGVAIVAQDQVVGQGEVAIAFQTVLGETVVPALIRRFRERYPGVRFALTQGSRQRCLTELRPWLLGRGAGLLTPAVGRGGGDRSLRGADGPGGPARPSPGRGDAGHGRRRSPRKT